MIALMLAAVAPAAAGAQGPSRRSRHADRPGTIEIVTFGARTGNVRIVRGGAGVAAAALARDAIVAPPPADRPQSDVVAFADPHLPAVTVLRGIAARLQTGLPPPASEIGLYAPAGIAALNRIAFAVDGAESGHGTNPAMWHPEPEGPQGPMQVSAAAAIDVGGGDRFDLTENRVLGRAYLARLYRRYGNWPDAVAAYNWGPGNMDWWIGSGRPPDQVPLEVEHYRDRVLRDTALSEAGSQAPAR